MNKADAKTIGGITTIVLTIVGSAFGAANYIGGKIYSFASSQTQIVLHLNEVQEEYKNDVVPRINTLEKVSNAAATDAAQARQRVDDMDKSLDELKKLATQSVGLAAQNLAVSQSHTSDIKATRNVVAPVGGGH